MTTGTVIEFRNEHSVAVLLDGSRRRSAPLACSGAVTTIGQRVVICGGTWLPLDPADDDELDLGDGAEATATAFRLAQAASDMQLYVCAIRMVRDPLTALALLAMTRHLGIDQPHHMIASLRELLLAELLHGTEDE